MPDVFGGVTAPSSPSTRRLRDLRLRADFVLGADTFFSAGTRPAHVESWCFRDVPPWLSEQAVQQRSCAPLFL